MSRRNRNVDDPLYDSNSQLEYDDDIGYDTGTRGNDDGTYGDGTSYDDNTRGTGYDNGTYDTGTYDDGTGIYDNVEDAYGSNNSFRGRPGSYNSRGRTNEQYEDEYDSAEEDDYYNRENEYDTYEYRNDEAEKERILKKQQQRDDRDSNLGKKVVAAICCCCICIITILVLVLLLVVFKEDDSTATPGGTQIGNAPTTPKPTPRPTYPVPPALKPHNMNRPDIFEPWIRETDPPTISPRPTRVASNNPTIKPTRTPTPKPTISPAPTRKVPPFITVDADADTYVYVDGFFQYEAFGNEDSFLVQNGLAEYYEFADAVGLISFDLSELPKAVQLGSFKPKATLELNHLEVAPQFKGRGSSILQVRKLVSTPMRIDTIHGGMLNKSPEGSILGATTFTVEEKAGPVEVDVSDLLYPSDFAGYDRNQLFLMLINNSTEQGDPKWTEIQFQDQAGDRFSSVESGQGPQLKISYF
jgi:hypothetical protein